MIRHGGLLRAFFFARPIRGSGHVWGIYPGSVGRVVVVVM